MKFEQENYFKSNLILIIGFLLLAFQGFLAWHFYLQRIGAFDPSYFLFLMMQTGEPVLPLGRLGNIPSQILPLWAISQGFSLELVMRLFSISFILLYAVYFCIIYFGLRDKLASIALLIVISVGFYHNFYYATAELYQGLALGVLVWSFIRKTKEKPLRQSWYWLLLSFLLSVWISFYHQLATLGILFVIGYELIGYNWRKVPERYILFLLVLVWAFIQFKFMSTTKYEQGKITTLLNVYDFGNILHWHSLKYMYFNIMYFVSLLILASATLIIQSLKKKYRQLIFVVLANAGFTVIYLLTYRKGESPLMYENYYAVYGILLAIPFCDAFKGKILKANNNLFLILLVFILCIAGWQNYHGHYTLQYKTNYNTRLTNYLHKQNIQKALVNKSNYPWHYAWISWSFPFETMLASATKHGKVITACTVLDSTIMAKYIKSDDVFFGPPFWPVWSVKNQISKTGYFNFAPEVYTKINTPVPGNVAYKLDTSNIEMHTPQKIFPVPFIDYKIVEVAIYNRTNDTIHSSIEGETDILLTYNIYNTKGHLVKTDRLYTELECDVYPYTTYTNGLHINRPSKSGQYKVEVLLIKKNGNAGILKTTMFNFYN